MVDDNLTEDVNNDDFPNVDTVNPCYEVTCNAGVCECVNQWIRIQELY